MPCVGSGPLDSDDSLACFKMSLKDKRKRAGNNVPPIFTTRAADTVTRTSCLRMDDFVPIPLRGNSPALSW